MTTPKGVEVVIPESTLKSQSLASIESQNQLLASFEKFYLDGNEEARRGKGNKKKSLCECHANNLT